MLNESVPITLEYARELKEWTCAWFEAAVCANFVSPPYQPDTTVIKRLRGYLHAGLSPADAAYACFGRIH
jgi:hypothetical protein